jgi:hypothetical protein
MMPILQERETRHVTDGTPSSTGLPPALVLAFAPVHKRHFGTACGTAAALLIVTLTLIHLVRWPGSGYPLNLLSQYFAGYSVSIAGALIGGLWAGFAGFVAGWFLAFSRNFVIAVTVFLIRTRAMLSANRDFLDHI